MLAAVLREVGFVCCLLIFCKFALYFIQINPYLSLSLAELMFLGIKSI